MREGLRALAAVTAAVVGLTAFTPVGPGGAAAGYDPLVCEGVPGVNDEPCPTLLTRWSNADADSGSGIDQALTMSVTADGSLYVVGGNTEVAEELLVALLLVVDADTNTVVAAHELSEESSYVDALLALPTGEVLVVVGHGTHEAVVVLDPVTGERGWTFDGVGVPGSTTNRIEAMSLAPDGETVAIASSRSGREVEGAIDGFVSVVELETGEVRWSHRIEDDEGFGVYREVLHDPDGGVYAVGTANAPESDIQVDMAVDAFDADGAMRWSHRIAGPGTTLNAHDSVDAAAMTPDGSTLVVSGTSVEAGMNDLARSVLTISFSTEDGSEIWRDRRSSPVDPEGTGETEVVGMAMDPTGTRVAVATLSCAVAVAGCVALYSGFDVADGSGAWEHVVTGVAVHTLPSGLAFDRDGTVLRALSSSVGLANILLANTITGQLPTISGQTPGFSVLTELDAVTGELQWESRYNSGATPTDYGFTSGMVDTDGDVVVVHTAVPTVGGDDDGTRADIELLRWDR